MFAPSIPKGLAMTVPPWKLVASSSTLETRIFTLKQHVSRSPTTEREATFQVLDAPDWVNVIALTPDGNVLLIRQFRHGTGEVTVEIPGGTVDPGESPLGAARRELQEETGFEAGRWEPLGVVEPNPAFLTNRTHTFLAHDARRTGPQRPDDNEEIEVEMFPLERVPELLRDGTIRHALVMCAFAHLALRGGLAFARQVVTSPLDASHASLNSRD
jgi:8-oxo-dGTP pyrophosphatase MutT (NUDIX family)